MEHAEFQVASKGDIFSETSYYQAEGKAVNQIEGHSLVVKVSTGGEIRIGAEIVDKNLYSADDYHKEEKVTKTQLAELLTQTGGTVFTVNYQKQPDSDRVAEAIESLNKGKFPTRGEIAITVDKAYKGEERLLRGYLLNVEPLMGRAKVVDLDVVFKTQEANKEPNPDHTTRILDNGIRLVDLRHINYIIFKQVKYSLK